MKAFAICCVAVLCLAAGSMAGEPQNGNGSERERCPVCGMFVSMFADWNSEIQFSDSSRAVFDGAKDMFKYYLDLTRYNPTRDRKDIIAIFVRDYNSKSAIDARTAYFVIWSNVYGPMGHEPVPFAKEKEARAFMKTHKGKKIVKFQDVTLKLLHSLDNP